MAQRRWMVGGGQDEYGEKIWRVYWSERES
jgi:hypothetical protein